MNKPDYWRKYDKTHRKLRRRKALTRYYRNKERFKDGSDTEFNKQFLTARQKQYARNKANALTPRGMFWLCRATAKRRGIPFHLTENQFTSFYGKPCAYCGSTFDAVRLDRIDNDKGYEIENVASCCWICNRAKGELSKQQFLAWISNLIRISTH